MSGWPTPTPSLGFRCPGLSERTAYGFYTDERGVVRPITVPLRRRRLLMVDTVERVLGFEVPVEKRNSLGRVLQHLRRRVGVGKSEFHGWIEENPEAVREAILESGVFSVTAEGRVSGWDTGRIARILSRRGVSVWVGRRKSRGKIRWTVTSADGKVAVDYEVHRSGEYKVRVRATSPINNPGEALRSRVQYLTRYLGVKRCCIVEEA